MTPAVARTDVDQEIWLNSRIEADISDHFYTISYFSLRYGRDPSGLQVGIAVPPVLGWRFNNKISGFAGFLYGYLPEPNGASFREYRGMEQINAELARRGRLAIDGSFRVEERAHSGLPGVAWRLRARLRVRRRLGAGPKAVSIVGYVEPMFHANSTSWGIQKGLDKIRMSSGLSIPVAKNLSVEPNYVYQYYGSHNNVTKMTHSLSITASIIF